MAIDRGFVLRELVDNALKAKQNRDWSASNRSLELIGKELGMFQHPEFVWNGDLATLTNRQLERLTEQLERVAYGDDRAALERHERQVLLEAGLIVDVEVEEPHP